MRSHTRSSVGVTRSKLRSKPSWMGQLAEAECKLAEAGPSTAPQAMETLKMKFVPPSKEGSRPCAVSG